MTELAPTVSRIVIEAPGEIAVISEAPQAELLPGQSRVETDYSGISAGTFMAFYNGTNPKMGYGWDKKLRVFSKGLPPDPADAYPKDEGYMTVGRVTESRNHHLAEGTLVAGQYSHKSQHIANAGEHIIPLPDGFDPMVGIWVAKFAPICLNGVLVAANEVTKRPNLPSFEDTLKGQRVAVLGAGMIGMLTGKFAQWAGAEEVVMIDKPEQEQRLNAARKLGMTPLAATPDLGIDIKHHYSSLLARDVGADLTFQCTGSSPLLHQGLRGLRQEGTLIHMGFDQGGSSDTLLGQEFHHNQLRIISGQIEFMPRAQAERWDRKALALASIDFLADEGLAIKKHTVTHVAPFSQASTIIRRLAAYDKSIIQAVLHPDGRLN